MNPSSRSAGHPKTVRKNDPQVLSPYHSKRVGNLPEPPFNEVHNRADEKFQILEKGPHKAQGRQGAQNAEGIDS